MATQSTQNSIEQGSAHADLTVPGGEFEFSAPRWTLRHMTPGRKTDRAVFDWRIRLDNDATLLDPEYAGLLFELRIFVWTMLYDARGAAPTAPGSLTALSQGVESLARWMVGNGMSALSEISNAASWEYVQNFLEHHQDKVPGKKKTRPREVSHATAWVRLTVLSYVYRQRAALRERGVEPPREPPFDGRAVDDVVTNDLDLRKPVKLSPLPDDVVLPILAAAQRMLGTPADDVIKLQRQVLAAYEHADMETVDVLSRTGKYRAALDVMESFPISTLPGETKPWTSLREEYPRTSRPGADGWIRGNQILRRLILSVQGSAVSCIHGLTGLRASELCSFDAGDGDTGHPSCVRSEITPDGLLEIFYCTGVESKTSKHSAEWVIGVRPAGSDYLPPPVRAFDVLHALFAPWRKLGRTNKLLVSFSDARGLPRQASSVGRMTTGALTIIQNQFLQEWCDLSHVSEASKAQLGEKLHIRGQQWRTTFATYLFRVDSGLLPAISRHFKHMSIAMTERGYIGTDVAMIEAVTSQIVNETTRFFFAAATGTANFAGGIGKLVRKFREQLREALPDQSLDMARRFVLDNQITLIPLRYGKCFIHLQPELSRCHELGGTTHWSRQSPNLAMRGPGTCAGCLLFAASSEDLPFWQDRAAERAAALEGLSIKDPSMRTLAAQLHQAQNMIRVLSRPAAAPPAAFGEES